MADPQDRGAPRAYTVLGKSFHDGRLYRGGEVIMLYDDEVGAHHQEIVPVEAEVPQALPIPVSVPVKRKWVRKVKPPVVVAAPVAAAPKAPVPPNRGRSAKPRA